MNKINQLLTDFFEPVDSNNVNKEYWEKLHYLTTEIIIELSLAKTDELEEILDSLHNDNDRIPASLWLFVSIYRLLILQNPDEPKYKEQFIIDLHNNTSPEEANEIIRKLKN